MQDASNFNGCKQTPGFSTPAAACEQSGVKAARPSPDALSCDQHRIGVDRVAYLFVIDARPTGDG